MGTARLDYERCDAIYEDVRKGDWTSRLFSNQASELASRLGPPDGVRGDGDRFWLAVSRGGDCSELFVNADGSFGQSTVHNRQCGLPEPTRPIGPPAQRKPRGE